MESLSCGEVEKYEVWAVILHSTETAVSAVPGRVTATSR
jgi:hypothetical protein